MLTHALGAFLEGCHLFLVAQDADDVVAGHDAQLRVQGANHLKVLITGPVEHHGINVLKYYVLLYHALNVFFSL